MIALLEEKRNNKQISQIQLASKIGITKGYLSRMEKHPNTCNPTINVIFKLSNELNVSPYKILYYFKKNRDSLNGNNLNF